MSFDNSYRAPEDCSDILGRYKTEERAKEVLKEIIRTKSNFEYYKSDISEKNLRLFNNFYIPISITKITNEEQTKETKNYSLSEAINIGVEDLSKQIEEEIENKDNITNKNVRTDESETSVTVTVTYEVIENIGENQKIESNF